MAIIHQEKIVEGRRFLLVQTAGRGDWRKWGIFAHLNVVEIDLERDPNAQFNSIRSKGIRVLFRSDKVDARNQGSRSGFDAELRRAKGVFKKATKHRFDEVYGEVMATPAKSTATRATRRI